MKPMNVLERKEMGLKEKVFQGLGDWLVKMAVEPRGCRFPSVYELELTTEMIEELSIEK